MTKYQLGALPSPPNERDYKLATSAYWEAPVRYLKERPPEVDQGYIGNCVSQATNYTMHAAFKQPFNVTFVYGRRNEGDYMGWGWYISKALDTLLKEGSVAKADDATPDTEMKEATAWVNRNLTRLLKVASKYKIAAYARLTSTMEIKKALTEGMYVVFACNIRNYEPGVDYIYDNLNGDETYGGHAMSCWGWDQIDGQEYFKVLNSWGTKWGDKGTCWMKGENLLHLKDCWAISITPSEDFENNSKPVDVRYNAKIKTTNPGYYAVMREDYKATSTKVGTVKDGTPVYVLREQDVRKEICYFNGSSFLKGWVLGSYPVK